MATTLLPGEHWFAAHRADHRARALYLRHYSTFKRKHGSTSAQFVSPGECLVLLTPLADAVFVWHRCKPGMRGDGQEGVCCSLFRNEGPHLSSGLILEAERLAGGRWPGERRYFTYVDPGRIRRKRDPGRCFLRAGWRRVGQSKTGLLLFEKVREDDDDGHGG